MYKMVLFQGDRGFPGQDGTPGRSGTPGRKGEKGISLKGEPGEAGRPGTPGAKGEPGLYGEKGEPGKYNIFFIEYTKRIFNRSFSFYNNQGLCRPLNWMESLKGNRGPTGDKGEPGPPGEDGLPGDKGLQGLQVSRWNIIFIRNGYQLFIDTYFNRRSCKISGSPRKRWTDWCNWSCRATRFTWSSRR